ncbi:MAG: GNAT family N-acetyltransferase, partial [Nocardioidaceae bacterium]|nr:GNAT family N-acetyltransferase [Nocardioidaceae bacterium]
MADHPDDPSDLAYVVDDPLSYGGIVLWEVDDVPVAMAGHSRVVAGTTRVGAVYAPDGSAAHERAVLASVCDVARQRARDVLAFAAADDAAGTAALRDLGLTPVLERVLLAQA